MSEINEMKFQIGKKKMTEINDLVDKDCWKAFTWIHSILLKQMQYLFFYHNQMKILGFKRAKAKKGEHPDSFYLNFTDEYKRKWKKTEEKLWAFENTVELCYVRSLIDEEYMNLKSFNTFRNHKIGHPNILEYLPEDKEVKTMCKRGLKLIENLDNKIHQIFFPETRKVPIEQRT